MKWVRLTFILVAMTMLGCAAVQMTPVSDQVSTSMAQDVSRVVFMRYSFVGSAIASSVYDVTGGDIEFIGVLNNETKISYQTSPGKHVFMVVSEAADYMEADLLGGKTYYSMVTPRFGAWKARFSMWPIRTGGEGKYFTESDNFKKWVNNTKLVENNEKTQQWFENNKESIKEKHDRYWPTWESNSPEETASRTLRPEDGM